MAAAAATGLRRARWHLVVVAVVAVVAVGVGAFLVGHDAAATRHVTSYSATTGSTVTASAGPSTTQGILGVAAQVTGIITGLGGLVVAAVAVRRPSK